MIYPMEADFWDTPADGTAPSRRSANALLSFAQFSTTIPVIGKHLEWMGPTAAVGLWGCRQIPEMFGSVLRERMRPGAGRQRVLERQATAGAIQESLDEFADVRDHAVPAPVQRRLPPLLTSACSRHRYVCAPDVRYGDDPALVLDVWRRPGSTDRRAPVLVFVPGGGWIHGRRAFQGYALLSNLVERGWVCLSVDYRVAPNHPWPQHLDDVTRAVEWTVENIASYGGDSDFLAIAGCSAGGHIASLVAMSSPDIDVAVGIYGRYDWEDRSTRERERFIHFLEGVVVGVPESEAPQVYHAASPIAQIDEDTPPFLVVHGTADAVIPVEQARDFVRELEERSGSEVAYLELPGAGHAFDIFDGARTDLVVDAIGDFLDSQYRAADYQDDGKTEFG
jgi:acetyl esterase/lipase